MGNRAAPHVTEKKRKEMEKGGSSRIWSLESSGTEKGSSDLSRTDMGFGGEGD